VSGKARHRGVALPPYDLSAEAAAYTRSGRVACFEPESRHVGSANLFPLGLEIDDDMGDRNREPLARAFDDAALQPV
jgi:hypothetical protein